MSIVLIRHGKTQGNLEGRYIGCRTDEGLCEAGMEELKGKQYPPVQRIYVSPLLRCLETARLIYPTLPLQIVPDFRECDFGDFEGKNYAELNGRADYQAWIDSNGVLPFPGGESQAELIARTVRAFDRLLPVFEEQDCAVIAHGGTLMAIMSAYAQPKRDYFFYQVKNGAGFVLNRDGTWRMGFEAASRFPAREKEQP